MNVESAPFIPPFCLQLPSYSLQISNSMMIVLIDMGIVLHKRNYPVESNLGNKLTKTIQDQGA